MQHLWPQALEWDQELPSATREEWICFFQEMGDLNHATFERSLTPVDAIALPILCIFSDASNEAFGACAYVRWLTESNEYVTRFIAAKSRVAPLKTLTIPRLELQAAVPATRLYQSIAEESRMQFEKVVFFSDSNIVLSWIRSQAREFKPFVSARVAEIQSNSDPSQWRHVLMTSLMVCRYAGMEAGARILTTARRGVASRQFNSWPEWSRKGTP